MVIGNELFSEGVMNQRIVVHWFGDVNAPVSWWIEVDAGSDGPPDDCP